VIAAKSFRYEVDSDGLATITLDRPDQLNALTFEVYAELRDTFRALEAESDVKAVVLTGAGRGFCSGGSVHDIIGPLFEMTPAERMAFTRMTGALIGAIRQLRKPVVAAINGVAAGAGAVIALAADFRVMSEKAKIAFLFVKVGLAGADMGAAYLLPRMVGLGRATELLMTGDFIEADEALRIGLFNRVVPAGELPAATAALVDGLVRGPAAGLAATKAALESEMNMDLESALQAEARLQAALMRGADFREGFAAFQERRPPRFEGAPE